MERVPVVSTLDAQPMVMMVSYKHQFYIQSLEGRLPRAGGTDLRVAQVCVLTHLAAVEEREWPGDKASVCPPLHSSSLGPGTSH